MQKINFIKGLTLIDLLFTFAIISLLTSVIFYNVTEAKKRALDAEMKTEASEVSNAVALYKNENNGNVPLSVSGEAGTIYTETDIKYQESMQLLVNKGYLSGIPKSSDGKSYSYAVDEKNNAFFAFKLRQGSFTNNTKNICPVTIENSGGTKSFNSCATNYDECTESSGVQCFDNTSTPYNSYCYCNGQIALSNNPSVVPSQICSQILYCSGMFNVWVLTPPSFMCTYTLSGVSNIPTCDGSSNLDYCQCI